MAKVFISYRRTDTTSGYAGWIYQRLEAKFGADDVFMDVDAIPLGVDFVEYLEAAFGISLGVLPAQKLAQTRPGARGAVLISGAVPSSQFGGAWPHGVPLQIHMMDADTLVIEDGDLDVARRLADTVDGVQLYLYPGDRHLFIDSSLPDYDQTATELVTDRITALVDSAP
jgi:hypothetical protein